MSAIGQEGAPGNGQGGSEAFDFERGYNELRPEYTRTTQELANMRDKVSDFEQLFDGLHDPDPEVQAAAMAALGLELEQKQEAQQEFVDPVERELAELRATVTNLQSRTAQDDAIRQAYELNELRDDYIGEAIGVIEGSLNLKFNDREEEALGNLAISMVNDQGIPDVQGAYNLLYGEQGAFDAVRQREIDLLRGAGRPPLGSSIPADRRPKTANERVQYVDERIRAFDQQY